MAAKICSLIRRGTGSFSETKSSMTNEEKGLVIQRINREILGEIAPYMDLYTGGERINRISFIIPIKEMKEAMKKANPEHFLEHTEDSIQGDIPEAKELYATYRYMPRDCRSNYLSTQPTRNSHDLGPNR